MNQETYNYASFSSRAGALILDNIIILPIVFFTFSFLMKLITPLISLASNVFQGLNIPANKVFVFTTLLVFVCLEIIYRTLFEFSKLQATPGKLLLGIKVVNNKGNRTTFIQAFIRNFMKSISGLILFIGYLVALRNNKCTSLHDLVAKTFVIKK